ncbi:hypothetical protein ABZ408_36400 [Streptomyces tibetensis]|uniref:hypothetical protein n=1 Tax=Streptomyces tibetensis TaxID=2382123 RepID=UPI0033E3C4FB
MAEERAGRAAGIVYRQWLVDASARYSFFVQVLHKLVAYAVDAADLAATEVHLLTALVTASADRHLKRDWLPVRASA